MGVWRVAQRLGQAAADYSESLSRYHADSRSEGISLAQAPPAVVLGVDGCTLGMQVRTHRRRRTGMKPLPALPVVEQGHFREVKTGVLLLPRERVEASPGRRSVVRRFLVTCLGEADEIFRRLYAQLRELGWVPAADANWRASCRFPILPTEKTRMVSAIVCWRSLLRVSEEIRSPSRRFTSLRNCYR